MSMVLRCLLENKLFLRSLLEKKLFVEAEKCKLHLVFFLGLVVQQGQLSQDPAKVSALAEWLTPSCCKQLQ